MNKFMPIVLATVLAAGNVYATGGSPRGDDGKTEAVICAHLAQGDELLNAALDGKLQKSGSRSVRAMRALGDAVARCLTAANDQSRGRKVIFATAMTMAVLAYVIPAATWTALFTGLMSGANSAWTAVGSSACRVWSNVPGIAWLWSGAGTAAA